MTVEFYIWVLDVSFTVVYIYIYIYTLTMNSYRQYSAAVAKEVKRVDLQPEGC